MVLAGILSVGACILTAIIGTICLRRVTGNWPSVGQFIIVGLIIALVAAQAVLMQMITQ